MDGARLMRVGPGARHPLYDGFEQGCPALVARCRSKAYLVAGDLVVADAPTRRGFMKVRFTDARGRTTWGFLPEAALRPAAVRPGSWVGEWRATEQGITIAPAGGRLRVEGQAVWGSLDPARVGRGGVNSGEFSGAIGARKTAALVADGECRVRLRLLGPYLLASDNRRCGGFNVTFNGVYRRR